MWIVKQNVKNGEAKIFPVVDEERLDEYLDANANNDDVDLDIYEVKQQKNGALKLTQIS